DSQRSVGLDEHAACEPLAQVVVAIIPLKQERRPADVPAPQAPVLHGCDVVERAERDAVRRQLTAAQLRAEQVSQIAPLVGEITGRAKNAERVDAQPQVLMELPIEQWAKRNGQPFHPIERAAGRDGQGRARIGRAPRLLDAEALEPAPQIWGRERDLLAPSLDAITERRRIDMDRAADGDRW